MQQKPYDLIAVGTGTAGAILAARIAQHGVHPKTGEPLRIASIEAGPYWKGDLKPGYGIPLRRRLITNMPDAVADFRWPNGYAKIVGGCSFHNGNAALLPLDTDYVRWQAETGVDWTKENFKEAAAEIVAVLNYHQAPDGTLQKGNFMFRDAVRQLGYTPVRFPMARVNCIYCGYCIDGHMCKYDSKSSSLIYAQLAEKHGVEIIPETEVTKILIKKKGDRGRAVGVEFRRGGQMGELRAPKVLVCANNINTPVLLMRSGYGPKEILGSKAIVENSNVGAHFSISTRADVTGYSDEPLLENGHGTNNGDYIFDEYGRADGDYNLFIDSNFVARNRDPIQLVLSEFAPDFGKEHKEFMRQAALRICNVPATMTEPKVCRGSVYPECNVTYTSDVTTTRRMKEGLEIARNILTKMGVKKILPLPDLDKRPLVVKNPPSPFHSMGTCRAGADRKNSVVNPRFESHDVDGLLIGSGAVLPRCGSSAWIPIAVVAAFAWRRIVKDHFSKV